MQNKDKCTQTLKINQVIFGIGKTVVGVGWMFCSHTPIMLKCVFIVFQSFLLCGWLRLCLKTCFPLWSNKAWWAEIYRTFQTVFSQINCFVVFFLPPQSVFYDLNQKKKSPAIKVPLTEAKYLFFSPSYSTMTGSYTFIGWAGAHWFFLMLKSFYWCGIFSPGKVAAEENARTHTDTLKNCKEKVRPTKHPCEFTQ